MLLGFLLVTIAFTGIMIYIRADNNSAVRNFFLHSWHKNYVVEEKNLAYINTTPKQEQVTVLDMGCLLRRMIQQLKKATLLS